VPNLHTVPQADNEHSGDFQTKHIHWETTNNLSTQPMLFYYFFYQIFMNCGDNASNVLINLTRATEDFHVYNTAAVTNQFSVPDLNHSR